MGKPIYNPYGMDPGFRATYDPYYDCENDEDVICPKCGAKILHGSIKCPACGEKITWNICPECGEKIECNVEELQKKKRKKKREKIISWAIYAIGTIIFIAVMWRII